MCIAAAAGRHTESSSQSSTLIASLTLHLKERRNAVSKDLCFQAQCYSQGRRIVDWKGMSKFLAFPFSNLRNCVHRIGAWFLCSVFFYDFLRMHKMSQYVGSNERISKLWKYGVNILMSKEYVSIILNSHELAVYFL